MYGSDEAASAVCTAGRKGRLIPLAQARRGDCGVVAGVGRSATRRQGSESHGISDGELEQRLLEIGFVEGARVRVLHEGPFGRDPLAVRIDDTRIALRRREAAEVTIELDAPVRSRR